MYTNDLADKMREFRNVDNSPVEFRVLDGASMSIMNLPQPIETRYLRINLVNYTNNPCIRLEVMGCQKQSCNDINECLDNNGGCQQKCLNRYVILLFVETDVEWFECLIVVLTYCLVRNFIEIFPCSFFICHKYFTLEVLQEDFESKVTLKKSGI